MVFAFGLMALGALCGLTGLLTPGLPDMVRLILFAAFVILGLSPYGIRCPRCRKSIFDNGTLGQLAMQNFPSRTCVGCGRDKTWVWPLQDRFRPDAD